MQTYRCLLVDDSESALQLLKECMSELSVFIQLTVCSTYVEAVSTLVNQQFDLIFFHVELDADNGLDLVKGLTELCPVIVVSKHTNYAVECFDLNITDYLQTPFNKARLLRAINRALNTTVRQGVSVNQKIAFLKTGRRLQKFTFDHIDYIEAYGAYCKVHYKGKMEIVKMRLLLLEACLPRQNFRRIHKSYIVNLNHITSYTYKNFYFGEVKIPIGIAYREQLPTIYKLL